MLSKLSRYFLAGTILSTIGLQETFAAEYQTQIKQVDNKTQVTFNIENVKMPYQVRYMVVHLVNPGDTLWSVAKQYGVDPNALMKLNQLNANTKLLPNQRIKISSSMPVQQSKISKPTNVKKVYTLYLFVDEKSPIIKDTAIHSKEKLHTVREGETLYRISQKFGVSITDLIKVNGLQSQHYITAGKTLRIPQRTKWYQVKEGDTLYNIALNSKTSVKELLRLNQLKENDSIYVGQQMKIPLP